MQRMRTTYEKTRGTQKFRDNRQETGLPNENESRLMNTSTKPPNQNKQQRQCQNYCFTKYHKNI